MEELITRRVSLRRIIVAAAALSPVLSALEAHASSGDVISRANAATRRRVAQSIIERDGRSYLQVGSLELPIIGPKATGAAKEYVSPFDNGIPLIELPEAYLGEQVTNNFQLREFGLVPVPARNKGTGIRTHDLDGRVINRYIRLDPLLPKRIQELRDAFGESIEILSPYRTVTYNKLCRGEPKSRHKAGQAADLTCNNVAELYRLADKMFPNGGVGYYPDENFVHVDTRGFRTRWKR